ncbi:glycosyltransferase family 2 protein [Thiohalomonas denitrificans]|uniref:glycosyltransferase family 2 protein n=1 Tax=Thiohalomonas denitrificans TaxID=415747 RepID=UPI0026EA349B|nr:glycosyltransferase family 2 protein [Thiohalomonas denitrificans]
MTPALSAVLIVKDEAENIDACLRSVAFADEIIVIDSGSSDDTVERARRYTEQVYNHADWHGYGIQRQRAQGYATGDWVLMIDADERVTPELQGAIRAAVKANDQGRVYALSRLSFCFGRFIRHGGWYPDWVERLFPREWAAYDDALVHERLQIPADMVCDRLKGDLLHYTYRDLEHYLVKSAGYATAWARVRQKRGQRGSLAAGIGHGLACFLRMFVVRLGFLDGRQGLLLALLSGHSTFAKYADLWVRQQPDANDVSP